VVDAPERIDTLVIPGASDWQAAIVDTGLVEAIGALDLRSRRTVSIGSGVFLLAEGGRLDGRRAVTHWELAGQLSRRSPAVDVDEATLFLTDGKYVSSAGVAAAIDMTLSLIEDDYTAHLANAVARRLVVFMARPGQQAQRSVRLQMRPSSAPSPRAVLDGIIADPGDDHSVRTLAARAGVSPRHLGRMFINEVGVTPMRYVDRARLEPACAMLTQGRNSLDRIAERCGIGSTESLRRLFRRELGLTPSDYRRTSQPAAAVSAGAGQPGSPAQQKTDECHPE
jgi:transcriptional regulator GlxA family with amidase domain